MTRYLTIVGCVVLVACGDSATAVEDAGVDAFVGDLAAATWQTQTALPMPRQEHSVLSHQGLIYLVGGVDQGINTLASLQRYDPVQGSWTDLADIPAPMHHPNAVVFEDSIYVLGFLRASFVPDARCFVYRVVMDSWDSCAALPTDRERGSAAVGAIGNLIYVAGGVQLSGAVTMLDVYDPVADAWAQLPAMPEPLDHAAFGVIDDALIIAGGRDQQIAAHSPRTFAYDPSMGQWSMRAPMAVSRAGTAGAVLGQRLFVFGGEGNAADLNGVFATVEVYDADADSWMRLADMPVARHGMGAAAAGSVIYVPGGATRAGFGALDHHDALLLP